MLERFTVDIVADKVLTVLLQGEPTPKLAHRFFRKGRRDGKKAFNPDSLRKLIEDVVHLAGSQLAVELTTARRELHNQIAQLHSDIDNYNAMLEANPPSDEPIVDLEPLGGREDTQKDSSQVLIDALDSRRKLALRRHQEAINDRIRSTAEAKAAALDAAQQAAVSARGQLPKLRRLLVGLPEEYSQRFETIRHTGEMLWSRYCNGFVQGFQGRSNGEADFELPSGRIDFEIPQTLKLVLAESSDPVPTFKQEG